MAEPFSDEEIRVLQMEFDGRDRMVGFQLSAVRYARFLATITSDRKRFEETIEGYTKDWAEQKRKFQKRIEELESRVAFWDRVNERQYDKWIQLSRFWQKAENKPNTLPDRMKLLEWLIQHIQEGVESFLDQTATIERLRGALTEMKVQESAYVIHAMIDEALDAEKK